MQAWWAEDHSLKNIQNIRLLFKNSWLVVSVHLVVLDKVRQSSVFFHLNLDLFPLAHVNLYEHTWLDKKNHGGRI